MLNEVDNGFGILSDYSNERWLCPLCYYISEHDGSEPQIATSEDGEKIPWMQCPRCDEHCITAMSFRLTGQLKHLKVEKLEEDLAHWKQQGREDRVRIIEKALVEKKKFDSEN